MSRKYGYIPVLRWKRGERVGLQQIPYADKDGVVPVFMLSHEQFGETKATAKVPARTAAEAFCYEASTAWGTDEFYLDASDLSLSGATHPITTIGECSRSLGLGLIPAVRLNGPPEYEKAAHAVAETDARGIGLKVDLQQMTSAAAWAPTWGWALEETDLIVDINNNVAAVAALGPAVLRTAFAGLFRANDWRSVTLVGTSMPDNFSGYEAGLHLIPRVELKLWRDLCAADLPYRLDYGDYATVPVSAAPPGISWGYPINVRYTLRDSFLICRGVGTTGVGGIDMGPQLVGHAKSIVRFRNREPLPCWADSVIDQIASGDAEPKGLEHWVQIGVNRHFAMTRGQLP